MSENETKFTRVFSVICLFLALGLFLAVTLRQLNLPGFYYDEALDLIPMLDLMGQGGTPLLRNIGVGPYPVMLLDYMGSLNGYLTVPFMKIFGVGLMAARLEPIFFSCVTLALAWLLARRWFGGLAAGVMALLLAAQPSFIWFTRQGISVTSVMTVFSVGAALAVDVWRGRSNVRTFERSNILLVLAGLLLGLGLWAKFLFFRWLLAFLAMELVYVFGLWLWRRNHAANRPQTWLAPRNLAWVLLGGVMGTAPLMYFNLVGLIRDGNPYTIGLLADSLTKPTQQFGVNNLNFFHNLQKALDDARVFVDGSYFWYNGVPFSNVYAVPVLIGSILAGLVTIGYWLLVNKRGRVNQQPTTHNSSVHFLQLLSALAALTLMGAFTVSGQWATHQFIMIPWLQMVVACSCVWVCQWLAGKVTRWLGDKVKLNDQVTRSPSHLVTVSLVILLLALPFSQDLWVSQMHHQKLEETGGSGRFSDAIYKLADYFAARQVTQPIALDWGIEKSVRVLTGNQVRPLEIFGYTQETSPEFLAQAKELLKNPDNEYIVLWDRFAVYNRRKAFTELANSMGKQVRETFIAHEKSGLPVYVTLKAE